MIDEAGAAPARSSRPPSATRVVTVEQIEDVVARIARIPPKTVSSSDRDVLRNLERNLKLVIYGQDKAIETLASAIKMSRSGLGDQRKPVGSFLFAGPTGVGKTEVTRQLAASLGVELVRFDMSEYMERHTVSRLIGAPPGYVGFDQGGLLTEAITKHPHCVLLLDEIEKAHPDVFNLLLQVMDHGTLTDNNGRKADFRHVDHRHDDQRRRRGDEPRRRSASSQQDNAHRRHGGDPAAVLARVPQPARRDHPVRPLDERTIERVVDKLIVEVEAQLEQKGVALHVEDDARAAGSPKRGYDPKMGARPMARVIQEHIKRPLAEELLFGKLAEGRPGVRQRRRRTASSRSRRGRRRSPRCSSEAASGWRIADSRNEGRHCRPLRSAIR